jgi:hypothetical protein
MHLNGAPPDPTKTALETLAEGADYALYAAADGSRFLLRYKAEQMTAHLVGEDAARFLADYEAITSQFPDWPVDQTLAQLWDQGGYSWLAVEDGG